jgi:hypothetical protein
MTKVVSADKPKNEQLFSDIYSDLTNFNLDGTPKPFFAYEELFNDKEEITNKKNTNLEEIAFNSQSMAL